MITLVFVAVVVFVLLVLSEVGWRWGYMTNEVGRKFVHITVGSFVAFWPFFLSWNQIRLLSLAFLVVVIISKYLHVFRAIHSVQRPTYGEFYFAIVVGLLTFVTKSKGIYAASLLQMSLADGMAAIVGVEYGLKKHRGHYKVLLGHSKTIIGTATFFVVSLAILIGYGTDSTHLSWFLAPVLAFGAMIVENLAVAGLDNLLVPLLLAVVLTHLH